MRGAVAVAVVAMALGGASSASAQQDQDATLYCTPDGGPLGMATDAEHTVLVGDPPLPTGVRTSHVDVAGVTTRVQESGPPGASEAVVFLHGSPDSSRDWDDLVAAGGKFTRTVAFDFPGYGKSDKGAAQVQTTDGAAAYIQGVLDKLGIKRALLVMHDFGGIWGLQWAVRHKQSLIGAVLIDSGVLIDYVPHPLALVWSVPISGELEMAATTRETWRANFAVNSPRGFPDGFVDRLYDDYDRASRCAILRYYRSSAQNFQTRGPDQAAALRPLNLPALVIWGRQDQYIPVEHAEKQKQAFPHARVEILDDSGHWPHIDNAARVRGLVVPFLRPELTASVARASAGQRRVRVPVKATGLLPAYEVTARLGRARSAAATVSGRHTLLLRLKRPLRAGLYRVSVSALGLPTHHLRLRVAPRTHFVPAPPLQSGPQFTG
jgi:pimeloyl-ACP methyl ester carboxylesterase